MMMCICIVVFKEDGVYEYIRIAGGCSLDLYLTDGRAALVCCSFLSSFLNIFLLINNNMEIPKGIKNIIL